MSGTVPPCKPDVKLPPPPAREYSSTTPTTRKTAAAVAAVETRRAPVAWRLHDTAALGALGACIGGWCFGPIGACIGGLCGARMMG